MLLFHGAVDLPDFLIRKFELHPDHTNRGAINVRLKRFLDRFEYYRFSSAIASCKYDRAEGPTGPVSKIKRKAADCRMIMER